ncbi:MAG TPA: hypothetical protein VJT09_04910 [Pyrinomonadaceae bacterium]|nr:hypothetical protein [Pyrinomonadaceae bacterium]
MKLNRAFAYLIGCIALVSTYYIYMDYVYMLGFPDGSITELGYGERRLAYIFIAVSITLGLCFFFLGWAASRKRIGKLLSAVTILYLLFVAGVYLVDNYYRSHLMDGTGG